MNTNTPVTSGDILRARKALGNDPSTRNRLFRGFVEAALFAQSIGTPPDGTESDEGLDSRYTAADIDDATLVGMYRDCVSFQEENLADVDAAEGQYRISPDNEREGYTGLDYVGHDFLLTRNRYGAGFWDGDLEEALGKRLTEAAQRFPQIELYIGDDERIYS